MELHPFLLSLKRDLQGAQHTPAPYLSMDLTDAAVNQVNADYDEMTAVIHPVNLTLSELELMRLSTFSSHYELSEGDFIRQAIRHYMDALDIMVILSQAAE